ncbi:MAG TPA: FAD-dependent oxidoreductase [Planctomycetota bacterium]|nr:FAD-dependent oxidoreductase [Planctomycetota bacterium]
MPILRTVLTLALATSFSALLSAGLGAADAAADPASKLHYWYPLPKAAKPEVIEADVIAYGATPAGVSATIQARRMGKTAVLVEFGIYIGGLTSSGLSATDGGNVIGGLTVEFYQGLGKRRGFAPAAAEARFHAMLDEAKVPIYTEQRLDSVVLKGKAISEMVMENGNRFRAKMFLDCTYEGDLFAKAGVSFHVGREGNAQYGETLNGVQKPGSHNFTKQVDPFIVPGNPKSGLLPGITNTNTDAPGVFGSGDKHVQAYNFRMFLAKMPEAIPFPKPKGFDPKRYELLARYIAAGATETRSFMQLQVGDSNNQGGFSTDNIGMNYEWPEATYQRREEIYQEHVTYQQGLMWFLANDERVPEGIRSQVSAFGLAKNNFPETGGWPHQLYVREARRLVGALVMTEAHCRHKETVDDAVGLGEYNMDSHNTQRFVAQIDGKYWVKNEGDVQVGVPGAYPVSYRALIPKKGECPNVLVPVCLSASHIAYGSIRMEPVFMVLGQSAATAAVMAIDATSSVQDVPYAKLRERLDADKQLLVPPPKKEKPEK